MLTFDRLNELLRYDPAIGVFTWRQKPGHRIMIGSVAGTVTAKGYVRITIGRRKYRAHRLAWLYMTGAWPEHEVDHENGERADNRWENLRKATCGENSRNRKRPCTNTSGFKGVRCVPNGHWMAQIEINGKRIYLGTFTEAKDAHAAYALAAREHHGEFARAA